MNNSITINETDIAVAEFLKANHIHFSTGYKGTKKAFDDKNVMDSWSVKIGKGAARGNYEFEYFTGTGHRLTFNKKLSGYACDKLTKVQINQAKKLQELLRKDRLDSTIIKLQDNTGYAVSPTQASVLYCLLADAISAEQNFNDWCNNFGYDNDSIKAFKTYQACCDTLEKMRNIFSGKQRAELSELLQDY